MKLARRDAGDALAQGRADAPVVLIEYADFKCGYCGKFARDTEPALVKKYVDDGTLRIEWRNFPIFGAESECRRARLLGRRAAGPLLAVPRGGLRRRRQGEGLRRRARWTPWPGRPG